MTISDETMRENLGKTRGYTFVVLKRGPKYAATPEVQAVIWEHGRRNMELREEGKLSIVCPMTDDGEIRGIGIFSTSPAETAEILEGDPGVRAEIFTYEVHPCRSFPGDSLPA